MTYSSSENSANYGDTLPIAPILRMPHDTRMARLGRIVAAGFPYHVTQRGDRRQTIFFEPADYALYIKGTPYLLHRYPGCRTIPKWYVLAACCCGISGPRNATAGNEQRAMSNEQ
jgi:hypothetical protein